MGRKCGGIKDKVRWEESDEWDRREKRLNTEEGGGKRVLRGTEGGSEGKEPRVNEGTEGQG